MGVIFMQWIRQALVRQPWMIAAVAVAVVVGVVAEPGIGGTIALVAYAVLNAWGVALYCEHSGKRRPVLWQRILQAMAVILVPVGLVAVLFTRGGLTPSEASTAGSPDDRIRRASSFAPHGIVGRGDGGGVS